ncbi:hypothetical protein [Actinoplanes sp. M2I2]|uniref:hypothetical protein n=1 Tax=Actinoplanes sp. M2I2 TaxID=1734444 RepID=UPI00201FE96C|nr:hypothetical protein [Actinoplanes sp. M2I2]
MTTGLEVLALFELPEPEPERPPEDAVVAVLRDPRQVDATIAGEMGWLLDLLAPAAPPACVRCGAGHVYRAPAGFVLACPACFPSEVVA